MDVNNTLHGRHVLVIGGVGLGGAVAALALKSGAKVTVSCPRPDSLRSLLDSLDLRGDEDVSTIVCGSLDDGGPIEASLEGLFAAAGRVDHVILTTDGVLDSPIGEHAPGLVTHAAHVGMPVAVVLPTVAARHLPRSDESSLTLPAALIPEGLHAHQRVFSSLTEVGTMVLTTQLAQHMAPVRVNTVRHGPVKQKEDDSSSTIPDGGMVTEKEVAEAYLRLLENRSASGLSVAADGKTFEAEDQVGQTEEVAGGPGAGDHGVL